MENKEIDKKQRNRENQKKHYAKDKEKIKEYKKIWYLENKEKAKERNKLWREKKKKAEEKSFEPHLREKKSLYDVIGVLRKNMRSYLWNKCIKQWTTKDWNNFKNLENDIRI